MTKFSNTFTRAPFVANGYIGQRIPAAGMGYFGHLGSTGWPIFTPRLDTAMVAGLYAQHKGKQLIATLPTWSTLTFAAPGGAYTPSTAAAQDLSDYSQRLDLKRGVVVTTGTWRAPHGHKARFRYTVFTDRARPHVGLVQLKLTPQWSGRVVVTSLLNGAGARRTHQVDAGFNRAKHAAHVSVKTDGLNLLASEAATLVTSTNLHSAERRAAGSGAPQSAGERLSFTARAGTTYTFTKFVAVATERDSSHPGRDVLNQARAAARRGFAETLRESSAAWARLWRAHISVVGGSARLMRAVRAGEYGLLSSLRATTPSMSPSGLSSDNYAGLIFWDADTWMFPALLAQHPHIARAILDYRYDTLGAARHNAAAHGFQGAFYPWTSALEGHYKTNCYGHSCPQELHLQGDIALAQWQYYLATGDTHWLATRGWPVLKAIAAFWAGRVHAHADGTYSIRHVQPPDEYHYDVADDPYTNAIAAKALRIATQAAHILSRKAPAAWARIAKGIAIPFDATQGIHPEFKGYQGEAIKQADVVMLTYPLEYSEPLHRGRADLAYYAPRTDPGGPAMTSAIHAIDAAALNLPGCAAYTFLLRSFEPFLRAPFAQMAELRPVGFPLPPITGGRENASMAAFDFLTGAGGFLQQFVYGFSGWRWRRDHIYLDPSLPPQLNHILLRRLRWQGRVIDLDIRRSATLVKLDSGPAVRVRTPDGIHVLRPGAPLKIATRQPDRSPTADLARCRKAHASSHLPGDDAVAAVDGTTATYWRAAQPAARLRVDLGRVVSLGEISVQRHGDTSSEYKVEVSAQGRRWHPVAAALTSHDATDHFKLSATRARYVRLIFPGGAKAKRPSISELIVLRR